jgi:Cu2+-exporting ATPase
VWLVERVPLAVPGVVRAELNISRSLAHIVWDAKSTTLSGVARFLDTLGYRAHPFRGVKAEAVRRAEDRAMLVRIGIAGALAGNVMLVALALYSGWFSGMEPQYERFFRWLSLALTTPAVLGPGRVFFRGAWASLRTRALHMDLPIALALGAGYTRGLVNTVQGTGPIYFDGVAALVFLLLAGRFLQQRGQRAAAGAAELLYSLSPSTSRVVEGDQVRELPAGAILPGMILDVRAGDTLAADGVVIAGHSEIDAALLSGESRPVTVVEGDQVYAGTVNLSSSLRVRVREAGESSRLGRILRDIEAGARRRAPVVQLANRLAGGFVAVVLVLAVLTGWIWMSIDPARALDNAIALLVVTCPCALALATPLAVTVGMGRAAKAGILIKGGDVIERMATPGRLLLDKTGTLTEGRTALVQWSGPDWVKPLVLALERRSSHPIAAGFHRAWRELDSPVATWASQTLGGGMEGEVEGRRVAVGSPGFIRARTKPSPDPVGSVVPDERTASLTPVLVAVDGEVVAEAGFGDPIRPDAADSLRRLRAAGWRIGILSGDDPRVVAAVGQALGVPPEECSGGASPEAKLRVVEEESQRGPVVMVGDGVNDAAAIARAAVGIGVRGGAEACLAASDVFLARPGLTSLVALTTGARRTMRLIRINLLFSLGYNLIGAGLAVTGVITPLIAAILMPVSSLTVILLSWRCRTFEPAPP